MNRPRAPERRRRDGLPRDALGARDPLTKATVFAVTIPGRDRLVTQKPSRGRHQATQLFSIERAQTSGRITREYYKCQKHI